MKLTCVLKRMICALVVATLLAAACLPAYAAGSGSGSYTVTASRLNVHSGASLGGVKTKLVKGTVVTYRYSKNGWWNVKYDGGSGFVDPAYLSSVAASSASTKYAVTANLRVRSKASTSGLVLGKLKKGLKVTLVKQSGSWAYISYKGKTGWVSAKYLKKVG